MLRRILRTGFAAMLLMIGASAHAGPILVDVYADAHSYNGGAGAGFDTGLTLVSGERLVVSAAFDDLWSAGAPPRDSNANGLGGGNFSCGTCGVFPLYSSSGLATEYGSLVGRIGGGGFFKIGTDFDELVTDSGSLSLFFWDSNAYDNSGFITASVEITTPGTDNAVSVPAPLALMAIALFGGLARRRRA